MSEFYISCDHFEEGGEIPKQYGYKHQNEEQSETFDKILHVEDFIEVYC